MLKKIFSMVTLSALLLTIAAGSAVAATGTDADVVWTQGFDEGDIWTGLTEAIVKTDGGAQSGDGYLSLSVATSQYLFNFTPAEGGDDANYILTFWAKTSVEKSLYVETSPYVYANETLMPWKEYCDNNDISCISSGEGKSYLNTGLAAENGSEWLENRVEFRVPKGCTHLRIQIGANPEVTAPVPSISGGNMGVADAFRAIDNISIKKAPYNLIRNGGFDGVGYSGTAENPKKEMPYSNWYNSVTNKAGGALELRETENDPYLYVVEPRDWSSGVTANMVSQTVYLYPGEYLLSMDVSMKQSRASTIINLLTNSNGSECTLADNQQLALMPAGADGQYYDKTYSYSSYFTVNTQKGYTLSIGSSSYYGTFTFDNIRIIPVEKGNLQFGTINYSATDEKNEGKGDFHFEYTPAKDLKAGDKVRAFGHAVVKTVGDSAQVLTSVYKVAPNGNRVLTEVKIDSAEAGKIFTGTEVTIPTVTSGETVEVKAMVLNSLGELKPFGKDFILQ